MTTIYRIIEETTRHDVAKTQNHARHHSKGFNGCSRQWGQRERQRNRLLNRFRPHLKINLYILNRIYERKGVAESRAQHPMRYMHHQCIHRGKHVEIQIRLPTPRVVKTFLFAQCKPIIKFTITFATILSP